MKKIISLSASALLLTSSISFAKTNSSSTEYLNIKTSQTDIDKTKSITRAEALKMIMDSKNIKLDGKKVIFLDVSENHWANEYIKVAFEKRFISGYGNKLFKPDEFITNIEFISMLVKTHANFDTNKKLEWTNGFLQFAFENKIIKDISDANASLKKEVKIVSAQEILTALYPQTVKSQAISSKFGGRSNSANTASEDTTNPQEKIVAFKDAGLKKFILDNLHSYDGNDKDSGIDGEFDFKLIDNNYRKDKNETEIYVKDMEQIEAIGIRGYYDFSAYMNAESEEEIEALKLEVKDLTGLEYAKNLKMLSVSSWDVEDKYSPNAISDISPLKNLQNLEILRLSHNAISNIEPISNLNNLKKLYISHNLITNIEPIKNMKNLVALDFSRNNIGNISAVSGLTNLTELTMLDTNINTLEDIKNLTNIQRLEVRENKINSIGAISKFENLDSVFFDNNKISDFTPLSNLTKITYVSSSNQEIQYSENITAKTKNFAIESNFKGFENIVQDDVTVTTDVEGINVVLNKETNQLEFTLSDEFVQEKNNSSVVLNLKFSATNKYEFYWSYETQTFSINGINLLVEVE